MLEELARDVTGWPAHAVEFFELLGWTQHREHLRFQSRWADVRNVDRMDRVEGPFDELSHTVDVRAIAPTEGWHNIHNIGFFLYRLRSYGLARVPARQAASAPWRYHFSPLGNPTPLFTRWRREGDEAGLATELHVPAPIRHAFFYEDLVRYRNLDPQTYPRPDFTDLYGLPAALPSPDTTDVSSESSFFIVRNIQGNPQPVAVLPTLKPSEPPATYEPQIVCGRLDPWPAAQPAGGVVVVDVETGRLALGQGLQGATASADVFFHYGFSSDLGGGPYERTKWLVRPTLTVRRLEVLEGTTDPDQFPSLTAALAHWAAPAPGLDRANAVITLLDSRTYALPGTITLRNEGFLVIEADSGQRPLLQAPAAGLEVQVLPPAVAGDPDRRAALTLSGVVVEGHVEVTGDLGRLRLLHSTLVPGRRLEEDGTPPPAALSVVVAAGPANAPLNAQLRVEIAFSILGALTVPEHADGVWLLDSIVDALGDAQTALAGPSNRPGPDLHVERSTVFGRLDVRSLEMSESIATGLVEAVRTQEGCVRFSYVPPGSRTPRRYRCQPDLGVEKALAEALEGNPALTPPQQLEIRNFVQGWLVPGFSTTRYGRPAYAQLRLGSPAEIRNGAEDGSEMGAFCHVKQPQRESNLRIRLDEYLPFGLEAGILFAT
jgi:hypothetical protein